MLRPKWIETMFIQLGSAESYFLTCWSINRNSGMRSPAPSDFLHRTYGIWVYSTPFLLVTLWLRRQRILPLFDHVCAFHDMNVRLSGPAYSWRIISSVFRALATYAIPCMNTMTTMYKPWRWVFVWAGQPAYYWIMDLPLAWGGCFLLGLQGSKWSNVLPL